MIIINRVLLVHLLLCQVPIGVEVSQLNAGCRELPDGFSTFAGVCRDHTVLSNALHGASHVHLGVDIYTL